MQLGMIGLGRMGGNMTTRLAQRGHDVKTYDPGVESTAASLAELRDQLDAPRAFWLMVPAGEITEDDVPGAARARRARATRSSTAATRTSATRSAATPRRGRARRPLRRRRRVGRDLGARGRLLPDGRRRRRAPCSGSSRSSPRSRPRTATRTSAPSGAGHFTKMVHNGIEYGLMQAYAEGFEVLRAVRVRPRPARDRRHLALRLGRPLVAARAAARRVRDRGRRARARSRATSRTPARAAGRSPRRSPRTCRCR